MSKKLESEDSLLQHTKEHCLVGIKGAIKRGIDSHFIHANIDTDVIVDEEPPQGSTEKPVELYRVIERFCMGRKRIELFGEDRNKRPGWLTLGSSLSNSNFNLEKYNNYFKGDLCYPDVQGYEGGRYVGCSMEIEGLRPRSPTRQPVNPLLYPTPINSGLASLNLPVQNSNGSINLGNIPIGNNLNNQTDFGVNQMMNVGQMLPVNFPFVNQINQMPNLGNIQRSNVSQNMNNNINNIKMINRTNY
jgi:hypothetical protein